MSLLTKSDIADILNISNDDISVSIYALATSQFYILTGLKSAEIQKIFYKFIGSTTSWIKLPDKDIKEINSLIIDTTEVGITPTSVVFNPDSGLLTYTGGFSSGSKVTIEYTINKITVADIHSYLLILLVLKQLAIFSPSKVDNVSSFRIGRYAKTFGAATKNQTDLIENLDLAIKEAIALIEGDDGKLELGAIG